MLRCIVAERLHLMIRLERSSVAAMERAGIQNSRGFSGISLQPLPILSLAAIVVPAVALGLMQIFPGVLIALERNPEALASGQWWRVISPLLVDSDGLLQFLFVSVGFVCVGIPVEHRLGRWRWLALFFAGALAGEAAGYAWQPYGGGTSIALCGLVGGMVVAGIWRADAFSAIAFIFALVLVVALAGAPIASHFGGDATIGAIVIAVLCGLSIQVFLQLLRRQTTVHKIVYFVGIVDLIGVVALIALHDNHGPALIAGACLGALIAGPRSPRVCANAE